MPAQDRNDSLVDADVDHICRALASYGAMPREALAKEVHAHEWEPGRFRAALQEAVRRGRVSELGEDFYEPSESDRGA